MPVLGLYDEGFSCSSPSFPPDSFPPNHFFILHSCWLKYCILEFFFLITSGHSKFLPLPEMSCNLLSPNYTLRQLRFTYFRYCFMTFQSELAKVLGESRKAYFELSHHFMGNRWGNSGRLYFLGLQNHCRW